jgi:hypothetical protein
MATQPFVTVDVRCACRSVLAQGRLLRVVGLFKAHNRINFFHLRPHAACSFADHTGDVGIKPPS